ncbi:MAG: hypothetical protein JW788_00380 [Candidatus Omnitrophica bacterium]|nr:hypothetical protein [Candidatus Omnitrophota bacterium]
MEKTHKRILVILCFILAVEWMGFLVLIYFARFPYFVSLFLAFVQVTSNWFLGFNIVFLFYNLFTKEIKFTWDFWREYTKELFRFFAISLAITIALIAVSAVIGTKVGLTVERISRLPTIMTLKEWISCHIY